jgi:predicted nucleic acid-binding protein
MLANHIHHTVAKAWWNTIDSSIAFTRFTQISVLRLLTTSAAMDGKPLTMTEAWHAYDRFFIDDRVVLVPEPSGVEARFREYSRGRTASPKLWADAWVLAFAEAAGGTLITFDRRLASFGAHCLLEA